jgi:hypothetical protein
MTMNRKQMLDAVRSLGLPEGDYLVHGSSALLARRLVTEVNDVDIAARGAAWQQALKLGPLVQGRLDALVRPSEHVEIFDGWLGADLDSLLREAELIDGIPFASLQAVLDFKLQLNRAKDQQHIRLLERELRRSRRA